MLKPSVNILFAGDSKAFFMRMRDAVYAARRKHPIYARDIRDALGVIEEECRELRHAVNFESNERVVEEAWDVAVTCIRLILGEQMELPPDKSGFGWEKRVEKDA